MEGQSVVFATFVIERSYPHPAERVFAALADPTKKRRWFVDSQHHDVEGFEMEFRIGGIERAGYRFKEGGPFPGVVFTNDATYQDIIPNRRVVTASTMTV